MNKSELDSKHLSELHSLAADAGVERYRMLPRAELIEKLAGGQSGGESKPQREQAGPKRQRRDRKPRQPREGRQREREPRGGRESKPEPEARGGREAKPGSKPEPRVERERAPEPAAPATTSSPAARPKRKRRRRWGRRPKGVRVHDLLLPAAPGRQTIVYAETREGCTALLRGLAADLAEASDGADPIALLIDPSPEELAEWRREAPQAEIVAAGQARHADDAIAQAARRASSGEDVVVLIDSLSRFAESYGDADGAKALFDAGRDPAGGNLTVVAAVERPS